MARGYKPPQKRGEYGRPEPAREEVRGDADRPGGFAWLYDPAINMTPEQLLEFARERMRARDALIDDLLKYVPRKHEDKIKALSEPKREAESAIHAVELLLGNLRGVLAAPDHPHKEGT